MGVDALGDADLAGRAKICAELLHHFQIGHGAALLCQQLGYLHAHHAAADDHHLAGGLDLTGQNVMAVGNVCALCAGDLRDEGRCADAVEHGCGLEFLDELRGDRGVQTDVHAHPLHLRSHALDGCLHLLLAGRLACQHELTAQCIGSLAQDGVMPLLLQGTGSLQACNTAACNQDGLGAPGGLHSSGALSLAADGGVAQAGDVGHIQVGKAIQTALIAAHAAVDILYPALFALVAEIRVCQLGTAHDYHIHLVGFQNVLGLLGVVDAAHADGQHPGTLADAGGVVHVETAGQIQRRHLVLAGGGNDVAAGNIQHIHTGILCPVAEGDGILYGQTGFAKAVVLCVDAHEQGHPLRDGGADGADALQREAGAVLQTAAVLVGAVVQTIRQEGVGQIVVGTVELDAVEPGSHRAGSSLAVAVHHLGDHFPADAGNGKAGCQLGIAGKQDHSRLVHTHSQPALPQLDARLAALGVDGISQLLQLGDVLVLCNREEHFGGAEGVDGRDLHDIQSTAAPCAGNMVCNVLLIYKTILGKAGAHGRHDDAVAQSHVLDGDGREQLVEHKQPPFESVLSVISGYHAPAGAVY